MTCMRFCKASTKMTKWTYTHAPSFIRSFTCYLAGWLAGWLVDWFGWAKSITSKGLKTLNCAICICNDLLQCIYRALALLLWFGIACVLFGRWCVPVPLHTICVCVWVPDCGWCFLFFCTFIIKQLLNAKFEYTQIECRMSGKRWNIHTHPLDSSHSDDEFENICALWCV